MVQKGQSKDNRCRVGCKAVEDMHHIFVECPEYDKLRKEAREDVVKKTRARVQTLEIRETHMTDLLKKAESLFINCSFTWPLYYTFYYLARYSTLMFLLTLSRVESDMNVLSTISKAIGICHPSDLPLAYMDNFRREWRR